MKKEISKKVSYIILSSVGALVLVLGGFSYGYYQAADSVLHAGEENVYVDAEGLDVEFDLFWEVWQKLRDNHVDAKDKTDKDFLHAAINGLTGVFNDPNTTFSHQLRRISS